MKCRVIKKEINEYGTPNHHFDIGDIVTFKREVSNGVSAYERKDGKLQYLIKEEVEPV